MRLVEGHSVSYNVTFLVLAERLRLLKHQDSRVARLTTFQSSHARERRYFHSVAIAISDV